MCHGDIAGTGREVTTLECVLSGFGWSGWKSSDDPLGQTPEALRTATAGDENGSQGQAGAFEPIVDNNIIVFAELSDFLYRGGQTARDLLWGL